MDDGENRNRLKHARESSRLERGLDDHGIFVRQANQIDNKIQDAKQIRRGDPGKVTQPLDSQPQRKAEVPARPCKCGMVFMHCCAPTAGD